MEYRGSERAETILLHLTNSLLSISEQYCPLQLLLFLDLLPLQGNHEFGVGLHHLLSLVASDNFASATE